MFGNNTGAGLFGGIGGNPAGGATGGLGGLGMGAPGTQQTTGLGAGMFGMNMGGGTGLGGGGGLGAGAGQVGGGLQPGGLFGGNSFGMGAGGMGGNLPGGGLGLGTNTGLGMGGANMGMGLNNQTGNFNMGQGQQLMRPGEPDVEIQNVLHNFEAAVRYSGYSKFLDRTRV